MTRVRSPVLGTRWTTRGRGSRVFTTAGLVSADTLPAASRAGTVYEYAELANTVEVGITGRPRRPAA